MTDSPRPTCCLEQLREVLLTYLLAADLPDWPAADGMTTEEVMNSYRTYAATGRVPGRDELLAGHPHLEAEIAAYFAVASVP